MNDDPRPPDDDTALGWLLPTWAMWTGRAATRHAPLLLAAGAFAAFVLKLLRVARGDAAVALELLVVSDKSQVALGTATAAAPGFLAGAAALTVIAAARACRGAARELRSLRGRDLRSVPMLSRRAALSAAVRASAVTAAALVLSSLVSVLMPRGYAYLPAVFLAAWLLCLPFSGWSARAEVRAAGAAGRHPVGAIVVVAVLTTGLAAAVSLYAFLVTFNDQVWLAPHLVVEADGQHWVGYRLAGEEDRVYLVERDRSIRRVAAADIRTESLCRLDSLRDARPLVGVLSGRGARTPRCDFL